MMVVVVVKSAVEVVMVGRESCAVQRLLREDVARAGLAGTGPFCYFYVPSSPPHRTLLFPQDDVSPGFPRRNFFCVDQTPDAHPLRLLLAAGRSEGRRGVGMEGVDEQVAIAWEGP